MRDQRSTHWFTGERAIQSAPAGVPPARSRWWRGGIAATGVMLLLALMAGTSAAGAITYAYDELGRLVAVVDRSVGSGTNAAQYKYDAVGNLTSITDYLTTNVEIFSFTPNNGPVGTTVTIYGDGFSSTPSQNTVTFNNVAATPTASTIATITTKVPTGASTGRIKVTSPNGTFTSTTNFTVN